MEKTSQNTQFLASLEGVDLTPEQTQRISTGIQEVVMKELAQIDNQGDLALARKFKFDDSLQRIFDKDILINGIRAKLLQQNVF